MSSRPPELKLLPDLRLAVDELSAQPQELFRRGLRSAFHTVPEVFEEPRGSSEAGKTEAETAAELEPELVYPDLVSFVQGKLSPSYRRSLGGTWCPSWWKHEEATSRLEALWRHGNSFASTAQRV